MAVTTASAQTKSSPGGNKQTAKKSGTPIYRDTSYTFGKRVADLSGARLQFKSSSPSVPAVSSGGVVTSKNPGVATITATVNGVSGSTVIIVKND